MDTIVKAINAIETKVNKAKRISDDEMSSLLEQISQLELELNNAVINQMIEDTKLINKILDKVKQWDVYI